MAVLWRKWVSSTENGCPANTGNNFNEKTVLISEILCFFAKYSFNRELMGISLLLSIKVAIQSYGSLHHVKIFHCVVIWRACYLASCHLLT